jgi:hypothetical protein
MMLIRILLLRLSTIFFIFFCFTSASLFKFLRIANTHEAKPTLLLQHTHTHTNTQSHTHSLTQTHTHIHTHTHTHIYTHISTHTNTQSHTHSLTQTHKNYSRRMLTRQKATNQYFKSKKWLY